MKTISFDTLGCSKNTVDTQKLIAGIDTTKYQISYGSKVHTLVINTCGFIKSAKKENIKEILRNAAEKKKGYVKRLVVIGCLTERYGDELMEQIPKLDHVGERTAMVPTENLVLGVILHI